MTGVSGEEHELEERLARLSQRRQPAHRTPAGPVRASANVCMAAGCLSLESDRVLDALAAGATQRGMDDVAVKRVGCLGLCSNGPLVEVPESHRLFERVDASSAESIGAVLRGLAGGDEGRSTADDPFFSRQRKVVLANSGRIDPEDIDDYVAHGGYDALTKAVTTMRPDQVVEEVTRSGLRGRGGAGYPTGLKWRTVAKADGSAGKFVICNADEGDPGAFMDRSVLEGDPQRVLEGMAIAGYAVGASRGYIYVRAEYPLAVKRLSLAIRQAERRGLLGPRVAETTYGFDVEIRIGAGAFVCGEETALIASVQGGRGTPRPRPPFPAEAGLWGKPTLINNVETFASIAPVIGRGATWYRSLGTEKSPGTKVFALAGRAVNTGLIEVPSGLTVREIVFDIGGVPVGRHRRDLRRRRHSVSGPPFWCGWWPTQARGSTGCAGPRRSAGSKNCGGSRVPRPVALVPVVGLTLVLGGVAISLARHRDLDDSVFAARDKRPGSALIAGGHHLPGRVLPCERHRRRVRGGCWPRAGTRRRWAMSTTSSRGRWAAADGSAVVWQRDRVSE